MKLGLSWALIQLTHSYPPLPMAQSMASSFPACTGDSLCCVCMWFSVAKSDGTLLKLARTDNIRAWVGWKTWSKFHLLYKCICMSPEIYLVTDCYLFLKYDLPVVEWAFISCDHALCLPVYICEECVNITCAPTREAQACVSTLKVLL